MGDELEKKLDRLDNYFQRELSDYRIYPLAITLHQLKTDNAPQDIDLPESVSLDPDELAEDTTLWNHYRDMIDHYYRKTDQIHTHLLARWLIEPIKMSDSPFPALEHEALCVHPPIGETPALSVQIDLSRSDTRLGTLTGSFETVEDLVAGLHDFPAENSIYLATHPQEVTDEMTRAVMTYDKYQSAYLDCVHGRRAPSPIAYNPDGTRMLN